MRGSDLFSSTLFNPLAPLSPGFGPHVRSCTCDQWSGGGSKSTESFGDLGT